jgi:hypothetical protein
MQIGQLSETKHTCNASNASRSSCSPGANISSRKWITTTSSPHWHWQDEAEMTTSSSKNSHRSIMNEALICRMYHCRRALDMYTHIHHHAYCIRSSRLKSLPCLLDESRIHSGIDDVAWSQVSNHLITNGCNYAIYPRILGGARWLTG